MKVEREWLLFVLWDVSVKLHVFVLQNSLKHLICFLHFLRCDVQDFWEILKLVQIRLHCRSHSLVLVLLSGSFGWSLRHPMVSVVILLRFPLVVSRTILLSMFTGEPVFPRVSPCVVLPFEVTVVVVIFLTSVWFWRPSRRFVVPGCAPFPYRSLELFVVPFSSSLYSGADCWLWPWGWSRRWWHWWCLGS